MNGIFSVLQIEKITADPISAAHACECQLACQPNPYPITYGNGSHLSGLGTAKIIWNPLSDVHSRHDLKPLLKLHPNSERRYGITWSRNSIRNPFRPKINDQTNRFTRTVTLVSANSWECWGGARELSVILPANWVVSACRPMARRWGNHVRSLLTPLINSQSDENYDGKPSLRIFSSLKTLAMAGPCIRLQGQTLTKMPRTTNYKLQRKQRGYTARTLLHTRGTEAN